jgi:small conductance mechanosensitive channel
MSFVDIITNMNEIGKYFSSLFENGFLAAFITAAAIALAAFLLVKAVNRTLRRMAERGKLDKTGVAYFRRIIDAVIVLLACVGIFLQVKPLHSVATSLLASSGVVAVILGFAAQQAMANVVGGFFISVFKPFSMGDRIKVYGNDVEGIVEDISLRHTVVRTFENNRVIVPNSVMNAAVIENTHYQEGKVCKFLDIGVSLEADIERAMAVIAGVARAHRDFLDNRSDAEKEAGEPAVSVRLTDIRNGVANLRASVWARDAGAGYAMVCDLLLSIKKRFDEEGILLPRRIYPLS